MSYRTNRRTGQVFRVSKSKGRFCFICGRSVDLRRDIRIEPKYAVKFGVLNPKYQFCHRMVCNDKLRRGLGLITSEEINRVQEPGLRRAMEETYK